MLPYILYGYVAWECRTAIFFCVYASSMLLTTAIKGIQKITEKKKEDKKQENTDWVLCDSEDSLICN